jgi:hypothetical protein
LLFILSVFKEVDPGLVMMSTLSKILSLWCIQSKKCQWEWCGDDEYMKSEYTSTSNRHSALVYLSAQFDSQFCLFMWNIVVLQ